MRYLHGAINDVVSNLHAVNLDTEQNVYTWMKHAGTTINLIVECAENLFIEIREADWNKAKKLLFKKETNQ